MPDTGQRDPLLSVSLRTRQWSEILACIVAANKRKLTKSEQDTLMDFMFEVGERAFEKTPVIL